MLTILDFKKLNKKVDPLDLDLIISAAIKKPRELVLAHPEKTITSNQKKIIKKNIARRIKNEPLAYILGYKEFFGLDFAVNKHTLVPRPETESLVELALYSIKHRPYNNKLTVIDIGTGSGNIIISIAKNLKNNSKYKYFALDISKNALRMAKKNATTHKVNKKIKFIQSDLLSKLNKERFCNLIIVANLPYLSSKIYSEAPADVKKYEPKSALYSKEDGLNHYRKLLQQIVLLKKRMFHAKMPACR